MGLGNPRKGITVTSGGTVGNSLAAGLVCDVIAIKDADSLDIVIKVDTVGSMTDLRVRPFITTEVEPAAFTAGGNASWAPVPTETLTAGAAVQDPYEAQFAAATWFPSGDKACSFRIPAVGVSMILVAYDGAGNGASSVVDVVVYHRRV
jgi:hypothetical protein